MPFAQYYQISVDQELPYNIYGNVQDHDDYRTPSAVWEDGGIRTHHSRPLAGGEQGLVIPVPGDARYVYTSHQRGHLQLEDTATGMATNLIPIAPAPDARLRFNIHAGQACDPFDLDTVYLGSQFLHKSVDRGRTWQTISPDLTTNDPAKQAVFAIGGSGGLTLEAAGGEQHTTIVVIAPSPAARGTIWVGTDDGNLQLTRDDGQTWTNLGGALPGVPPGSWIAHIEPSASDIETAFVVVDNHRRGDFVPYLASTTDGGRTWTSLVIPEAAGNAYVIVQDLAQPTLLFLGTEFGLWVSLTGGTSWFRWTHGVPTVSVRGLVVHPRDGDLVVGTFGRGLFILDDLGPLRALAADPTLLQHPAHLFPIPPVVQYWPGRPAGAGNPGDTPFVGENRPYGALLTYVGDPAAGDQTATIEVIDAASRCVRQLTVPATPGLNRAVWDLRHDGGGRDQGWPNRSRELPGPHAVPGSYTIRIRIGGYVGEQTVEVLPDPRLAISAGDRRAKLEAVLRTRDALRAIETARRRAEEAVAAIDLLLDRAGAHPSDASTPRSIAAPLRDDLVALGNRFRHTVPQALGHPETTAVLAATGSIYGLAGVIGDLYEALNQSWDAPTEAQSTELERATARLRASLAEFDQILVDRVRALGDNAAAAGIGLMPPLTPVGEVVP